MPDFEIHCYNIFLCRRGGVLIGTKRHFCPQISILPPLEMLWLRCGETRSSFIMGICYSPQNNDPSLIFDFNEALSSNSSLYPRAKFLLVGEFSYPCIYWNNLSSLCNSNECTFFIETCFNRNVPQVVLEATRITSHSSNILNLFFAIVS